MYGSYVMYRDKLNKEYRDAFNYIEYYGQMHMIGNAVKNVKMMDLIDLFLEAQEHEKPVKDFIGDDIAAFSKQYFSDCNWTSKISDVLVRLNRMAWFVLVFEMIAFFVSDGMKNIFALKSDATGYLLGMVVAFSGIFIADIVGAILLKHGKYSSKIYIITAIAGTIAVGVLTFMMLDRMTLNLPVFPMILCCGVYIIIFKLVTAVFDRKMENMGKDNSAYQISFGNLMKETTNEVNYASDISVAKNYAKGFDKKNASLIKHGKIPFKAEEYFNFREKTNRAGMITGAMIGNLLALLGVIVDAVGKTSGKCSFFSLGFSLAFFAVFIYLEFRVFRFIITVGKKSNRQVRQACQEKGMNPTEYYAFLKEEKSRKMLKKAN